MSRALIPCGALAGVSWVSWTWLRQEVPRIALQGLIQLATPRLPVEFEALVPERPVLETIWTVGGAFILWHSWREVVWVFKAILGVIYWLVCFIGSTLEGVTRWWQQCFRTQRLIESHATNLRAAEQEVFFTWRQMAVVAGGPPLPLGTFVLVSRPPGWDEVLVVGFSDDMTTMLCRTTTADGGDWAWTLVQVNGLHLRLVNVLADGSRQAPAGVDGNLVNWACVPPAGQHQWRPTPAEIANLTTEGNLILAQYRASPGGYVINHPGVGGDLQSMVMQLPGPIGPGGAGGGGSLAGAAPVVPALGLGGNGDNQNPSIPNLKALESAVQQLQALALSPANSTKSRDRSKKRKKDKKKKKRKKKKRSGSSSSSTSSSRSRSRSSSSPSSEGKKKPLRWKQDGRDRRVPLASLTHVDQLKLKKRGDLVAFAARHPGALTAHFLASVYSRLSKGALTRSGQLREVSVTSWAQQFSGLTEVRDMKEVITLAEILDAVNRKEIAQALDVLCQRILAIQAAKTKGGTWEKAESIELVDNRKSLASSSMLALTNQ